MTIGRNRFGPTDSEQETTDHVVSSRLDRDRRGLNITAEGGGQLRPVRIHEVRARGGPDGLRQDHGRRGGRAPVCLVGGGRRRLAVVGGRLIFGRGRSGWRLRWRRRRRRRWRTADGPDAAADRHALAPGGDLNNSAARLRHRRPPGGGPRLVSFRRPSDGGGGTGDGALPPPTAYPVSFFRRPLGVNYPVRRAQSSGVDRVVKENCSDDLRQSHMLPRIIVVDGVPINAVLLGPESSGVDRVLKKSRVAS
ncbi:hypothetical protein AAG570_004608 [Ranatra chinensis]|uniref:Uncharacterized protein n=1 Tax=Ranatra chinensis TaxID=642074 RepID=A0ABD0Y246_9HEMI